MNRTKRPNFWIRTVVIFVIVALTIAIVVLTYSTNKLLKEKQEMENKLYEEQLKLDELENKFNSEVDDKYIEELAREHGYNKQNEVIFYNNLPES